jgi:Transport and Golgi organisation 2
MCTVTYLPTANGYFLTSNRDEKNTRSKALLPEKYTINNTTLLFPKDIDAGGTWITLKENGDALCLLNGAFNTYVHTNKYTVSRGKVVLQIASSPNMASAFNEIDLQKTAPFTLLLITNYTLLECRWDGEVKYSKLLNGSIPHIWSSATLYNKEQQQKRKNWFATWLTQNNNPSLYSLFNFHKNTGDGDKENDLVINRNNKLFTVSITGILVDAEKYVMHYTDLITNDSNTHSFTYDHSFT